MFREDNNGFINFPIGSDDITTVDYGKTLVYLVAFETWNKNNDEGKSMMSYNHLFLPGVFVSDDMHDRPSYDGSEINIVNNQQEQESYDKMYFPNLKTSDILRNISIPLISSICVGWSDHTYEFNSKIEFWRAGFNDLTNEGKNLYYCMKKLHNNKEVRMLTFSNI